jgi:hypothetical protein
MIKEGTDCHAMVVVVDVLQVSLLLFCDCIAGARCRSKRMRNSRFLNFVNTLTSAGPTKRHLGGQTWVRRGRIPVDFYGASGTILFDSLREWLVCSRLTTRSQIQDSRLSHIHHTSQTVSVNPLLASTSTSALITIAPYPQLYHFDP